MADRMYPTDGTNPQTGEKVTEYPSVTTITGLLDKPFLIQAAVDVAVDYINFESNAYNGIVEEYTALEQARTEYRRQWNAAALFGTKVHAIAERYFSKMCLEHNPGVFYTKEHRIDGKTEYEDCKLVWDDDFRHLYKGLYAWCEKNKIVPISQEQVVYGEGYAGRYDLVCTKDGVVTMIDIKTGKGSYYEDWKPQLAAYRKAYNNQICTLIDTENCDDLVEILCESHECTKTLPIQAHSFLKYNKTTKRWNYKDFSNMYDIHYKRFLNLRDQWWLGEEEKQIKEIGKAKKWLKKTNSN